MMKIDNIQFTDLHPSLVDFKAEVLNGLATQPKTIPPKFFYDQHGSQLFDRITELPEYYPTRTEIAILQEHGEEMALLLGKERWLLELGSGSNKKIRVLLNALQPATYLPIDISKEHLLQSAQALATDFPKLKIHAICADYSSDFQLPCSNIPNEKRVAFFPGSSIGNFEPSQAQDLLRRVAKLLWPKGALLIGVDLKKAPNLLHAAYNDAQGVTAAFNLNLLSRLNRELEADFKPTHFEHYAFYNVELGRVEMHLVSKISQEIQVAGQKFTFAEGESIHTENSCKYTVTQFQNLAKAVGFQPEKVWVDAAKLFSVHCLRVN